MNGINWFRFVEPAGTKLDNSDIGTYACKTHAGAWVNGADPTVIGEIVDRTACFRWTSSNCQWSKPIKISLCVENNNEQFYVYQLNAPTGCSLAYCAKSSKWN